MLPTIDSVLSQDCHHGLSPGLYLLNHMVFFLFVPYFFLIFGCEIKLAVSDYQLFKKLFIVLYRTVVLPHCIY